MVAALAIAVLEERGVEADDVIGTLATRAADAGTEVVIVTGDKDFQQLVGPRISLLDTMYGKRTTLDDVRARYGVEPERWVDIVGLMGDAIDNIPGIRGIGEKTAAALIRHAGTLEALLGGLDGLETSGIRGAKNLRRRPAHERQTPPGSRRRSPPSAATCPCDSISRPWPGGEPIARHCAPCWRSWRCARCCATWARG